MWEVTFFDGGLEIGTFDYEGQPQVGTDYGDCVVVGIRSMDTDSLEASVDIEYR